MYGIFTKIYPKNNPNVGKHTIHRASGYHSPNTITTIISFSNAKNYSSNHDPQITRNYSHPSEKYEFVSWGDEIPNMEKNKKMMFQTTNHYSRLTKHYRCLAPWPSNNQGVHRIEKNVSKSYQYSIS